MELPNSPFFSHVEYMKDGLKHMRLKFYIEGSEPRIQGTVHSEVKEVRLLCIQEQKPNPVMKPNGPGIIIRYIILHEGPGPSRSRIWTGWGRLH